MSKGKGVSYSTSVRTLGNGWVMDFDTIQYISPATSLNGLAGLEQFYNLVTTTAANKIFNGAPELPSLAFKSNGLSLQLASPDPISWNWIINFVGDMTEDLGLNFLALFEGTAYNNFWEKAAIKTVLSAI